MYNNGSVINSSNLNVRVWPSAVYIVVTARIIFMLGITAINI